MFSVFGEVGVFTFSGKTTTDMTFLFVDFKDILHLSVEGRVFFFESFAHIFMYGAFRDTELFCCCTDSCSVFDDILSKDNSSVRRVGFHIYHSFGCFYPI